MTWLRDFLLYASLFPLAGCFIAWCGKRTVGYQSLGLAAAFCVSFFFDLVAIDLLKHGHSTWITTYLYAPIQVGIMIGVFAQELKNLLYGLIVLAILTTASWLTAWYAHQFTQPEWVVIAGGAGMVCIGYAGGQHVRAVRLWGISVVFLFLMGLVGTSSEYWPMTWVGHQVFRVTALGLIAWGVWRGPGTNLQRFQGPWHLGRPRADRLRFGLAREAAASSEPIALKVRG